MLSILCSRRPHDAEMHVEAIKSARIYLPLSGLSTFCMLFDNEGCQKPQQAWTFQGFF